MHAKPGQTDLKLRLLVQSLTAMAVQKLKNIEKEVSWSELKKLASPSAAVSAEKKNVINADK